MSKTQIWYCNLSFIPEKYVKYFANFKKINLLYIAVLSLPQSYHLNTKNEKKKNAYVFKLNKYPEFCYLSSEQYKSIKITK